MIHWQRVWILSAFVMLCGCELCKDSAADNLTDGGRSKVRLHIINELTMIVV